MREGNYFDNKRETLLLAKKLIKKNAFCLAVYKALKCISFLLVFQKQFD
jgi:hypothetical protein